VTNSAARAKTLFQREVIRRTRADEWESRTCFAARPSEGQGALPEPGDGLEAGVGSTARRDLFRFSDVPTCPVVGICRDMSKIDIL